MEDDEQRPDSQVHKQHQMSERREEQLLQQLQEEEGAIEPGLLKYLLEVRRAEPVDCTGWLVHMGSAMTPGFYEKEVPSQLSLKSFSAALQLYLGIPPNPNKNNCLVCDEKMSSLADHALHCPKSKTRHDYANLAVDHLAFFARRAELSERRERPVNGGQNDRRPGDLEIKSFNLEPILIDHTAVNLLANHHWPAKVGQLACQREGQKYASYKKEFLEPNVQSPKILPKQDGADLPQALARATELWHDRVKFKQRPGATNQTFWPACTELMGTLGPHMRILLDQLATRIDQALLGSKEKNLKFMRLALSVATYQHIGRQILRCCSR